MTWTNVIIIWGSKNFPLRIDLGAGVAELKKIIFDQTGVPLERQKIIFKGNIKNETNLDALGIVDGTKILLIGTADPIVEISDDRPAFLEDLSVAEQKLFADSGRLDCGILNIGNTCYLSSVTQFLRPVEPIVNALKLVTAEEAQMSPDARLARAFGDLFRQLESNKSPCIPGTTVVAVCDRFPQFARKTSNGQLAQQDAEELLNQILTSFGSTLKLSTPNELFGFKLAECTSLEGVEGAEVTTVASAMMLRCLMGAQTNPTNFLSQGLELGLEDLIEKFSPALERDAQFRRKSKLMTLPPHLIVHLARFEWKRASSASGNEATRTKVCRKIEYPETLNLIDYCCPELSSELKAKKLQNEDDSYGCYDLEAIVSHEGRTAESGHYIAWKRMQLSRLGGQWIRFDDHKVTEVGWSQMRDLYGGKGDSHIAFLLLYRQKPNKECSMHTAE